MVVDWDEPATWRPYFRAAGMKEDNDIEYEIEYAMGTQFALRNAIEKEMGLALTQKDDWNKKEDTDDRLLCEYILQNQDPTECKTEDGWGSLHINDNGGPMSYIPKESIRSKAFTRWFGPRQEPPPQSPSEWLKNMWVSNPSTAADFWVRRFVRLGVAAETRDGYRRRGVFQYRPGVGAMTGSYHTFLSLQTACKRILSDMYADRLALLLLAARHDSSCALSTHFPALRFEACKPFMKMIASFLTKPLTVVDTVALAGKG